MKDLKKMRQRFHSEIPAEADAILAAAKAEGREINDEELKKLEALKAEKDHLAVEITEEEHRRGVVESLTANREPVPPTLAGQAPSVDRPQITSDERPFPTLGHQCQAVAMVSGGMPGADLRAREDALRRLAAASGMSQAIPSEGGFAVLPEFSASIWDRMNQGQNNLLGMTDSYPVSGESITFLANAETSRATGSRYGGVQGYWINEADTITASKPKLRQVKVEPQELAVLCYLTDKLMANNAVALDRWVSKAAADEISFLVGDAIVNGTGAGQPKGIMSSGCMISVAKETGQAAVTFNNRNVTKMWNRLHPAFRGSAVWLINNDVQPQLDEMVFVVQNVAGTENVGGGYSRLYNPDNNTLKGRPVVPVEFCATLGTTGDVILADMSGYLSGLRAGGIKEAMSIHVKFESAQTAFRFMFAVDGQTWMAAALTPYKGTTTTSAFVKLDTRA